MIEPPFIDANGTTWYRAVDSFGWTSQREHADPAYFHPGAPAPVPTTPEGHIHRDRTDC